MSPHMEYLKKTQRPPTASSPLGWERSAGELGTRQFPGTRCRRWAGGAARYLMASV